MKKLTMAIILALLSLSLFARTDYIVLNMRTEVYDRAAVHTQSNKISLVSNTSFYEVCFTLKNGAELSSASEITELSDISRITVTSA